MTESVSLHNLQPGAIREWNDAVSAERTIDVAWLFAADEDPASDVRLTFEGASLVDVRPVPERDRASILDVAVIPRLVNAHTHLEFSTLSEPLAPANPFPDWIRSVIRWRIENPDVGTAGIVSGLQQCTGHGIAAVGEITTSDDAVELLATAADDLRVVSFRELIGLLPDRVDEQVATMNRHLQRLAGEATSDRVMPGISPHAPYSVHPDLVAAAVDRCAAAHVPMAMHLGETADERELLESGTGRFVDFLKQMDLWDADVLAPGGSVRRYLELLAGVPQSLAVHCNYLTDDEICFLGRHPQIAVVYCPRTHHYFGHEDHPWKQIKAAGGTVVLGTDGRGSNPDLSIWKELQFLAQQPSELDVAELVGLVTTEPAAALGLAASSGKFDATLIQLPMQTHRDVSGLVSPEARPLARLCAEDGAVRIRSAVERD